jgi:hypothetical protein
MKVYHHTHQRYNLSIRLTIIVFLLIALLPISCHLSDKKHPDVSAIQVPYKSIRFDRAVFSSDTTNIDSSIHVLTSAHPFFAAVYFEELTGVAKSDSYSEFLSAFRHFLTYKDYRNLFDTVQKRFPDTKKIDVQLEQLFKHVKYYFPKQRLGEVFYFISSLNSWSAVTVDTSLGIGLDMYLGKDYPFYPSVQLPMYEIERCEPEYIPVNASKVIYEDMFPIDLNNKTLLDMILMKGKEMLFAEYVLPDTDDALLMGYTPAQLAWCQSNEAMIWNYFSVQKLLYSTNWQDILRYINDGPTSTGMPPESPGNIGTWIGWQIMRKYMDANSDKTLTEILQEKIDSQTLLRESGYRPR